MDQAKRESAEQIENADGHARLDQVGALADIAGKIDRREPGEQADEQERKFLVGQQRRQHADLHHGEKPHPRAQQQRDQKGRKGGGTEKVELRHVVRIMGEPDEIEGLDHDKVEPRRAQDQDQARVGTPDLGTIELEQHQAAQKDDEGENLVFAIVAGRVVPRHAKMQQHDEPPEQRQAQQPTALHPAPEAVLGVTEPRLVTGQSLADETAALKPIGDHGWRRLYPIYRVKLVVFSPRWAL